MPFDQLLIEGGRLALTGLSVVVGFLVCLVLATMAMSRLVTKFSRPAAATTVEVEPTLQPAMEGVDPRHLSAAVAAVAAYRARHGGAGHADAMRETASSGHTRTEEVR